MTACVSAQLLAVNSDRIHFLTFAAVWKLLNVFPKPLPTSGNLLGPAQSVVSGLVNEFWAHKRQQKSPFGPSLEFSRLFSDIIAEFFTVNKGNDAHNDRNLWNSKTKEPHASYLSHGTGSSKESLLSNCTTNERARSRRSARCSARDNCPLDCHVARIVTLEGNTRKSNWQKDDLSEIT